VVRLAGGERRNQAIGREALDAAQALVQRFGGDRRAFGDLQRLAHAFDHHRAGHHANVVVGGADQLLGPGAFALGDDVAEDVLDHFRFPTGCGALELEHTLDLLVADHLHVRLRQPHDRGDAVSGDAVAQRLLQRHRLADAAAPDQRPVRLGAAQLGPRRRLFIAGRCVGKRHQLETAAPGEFLQQWQRLAAVRRVDVHEGDLLALQVLVLLRHVFDQDRCLRPVARRQRQHVGEHRAVGSIAAAGKGRHHVDLVLQRTRNQCAADRCRQRVDEHHAVALEALVGFDAALRRVAARCRCRRCRRRSSSR
jgi:hypothetical protein